LCFLILAHIIYMKQFPRRFLQVGKHIKTIARPALQSTLKNRGCGECQTSCQSACKTSITVSNQACKKERA